jgi:hypothetical protein
MVFLGKEYVVLYGFFDVYNLIEENSLELYIEVKSLA